MSATDTIFALSSGQGLAGIAVVRVSGPLAGESISRLCGRALTPRRASVRVLRHPGSGDVLDQAVVLWWPGPGSFTGEDAAEFHVHGGRAVVQSLLSVFGSFSGFRLAEAGEFTRRAFGNGRIDLVEAEGVADLLAARGVSQQRQAMRQLLGEASTVYAAWRRRLLHVLAMAEAAIDFDEEGVGGPAVLLRRGDSADLAVEMQAALAGVDRAKRVRDGLRVVLAGLPNTGKSSLLNGLAQRDAAIVSPRAGTTRDAIEVSLVLGGHEVIVTDTAGLRKAAADEIETIGVDRALTAAGDADVLVWVAAPDVARSADVWPGLTPDILVHNKSDLGVQNLGHNRNESSGMHWLQTSAKQGLYVELVDAIATVITRKFEYSEQVVVVRERHAAGVRESIRLINESLSEGLEPELVAELLRRAAVALGRITGVIDVEDVLGAIFSEFCIGK